ncbi:hypothetical protein [Paenibacillus sp. SI8]|uniref:hypothetical protein n=1 Tax=unclassified Paenibacillus TaxID=185978 RepID=UPI003465C8E1
MEDRLGKREEASRILKPNGTKLWETRQVHVGIESLTQDLMTRTGRAILHQLDDSQLQELVAYILEENGAVRFCEHK